MRSRYSAYVLKLAQYLLNTWDPDSRPDELDLQEDEVQWQGLRILATEQGGLEEHTGIVEFVARFDGQQLHERSRFSKQDGQWLYVDGDILPPLDTARVRRNDPCPCGSGKKYKKCCG